MPRCRDSDSSIHQHRCSHPHPHSTFSYYLPNRSSTSTYRFRPLRDFLCSAPARLSAATQAPAPDSIVYRGDYSNHSYVPHAASCLRSSSTPPGPCSSRYDCLLTTTCQRPTVRISLSKLPWTRRVLTCRCCRIPRSRDHAEPPSPKGVFPIADTHRLSAVQQPQDSL